MYNSDRLNWSADKKIASVTSKSATTTVLKCILKSHSPKWEKKKNCSHLPASSQLYNRVLFPRLYKRDSIPRSIHCKSQINLRGVGFPFCVPLEKYVDCCSRMQGANCLDQMRKGGYQNVTCSGTTLMKSY